MVDSVDRCDESAQSRRRRLHEAMFRPLGCDLVMTTQSAEVPKQSVEEILTAIRRIIAEHDSLPGRLKQASPLPLPDYAAGACGDPFESVNHYDWDAESDGETLDHIEHAIEK